MRNMNEMPTDGEIWEIENVSGFTMATTAAVKNRSDLVKTICCIQARTPRTASIVR